MSLPETRVLRPKTVEEAVRILAGNGPDAMILAGGTDVVPNLQMKLFSPRVLVDIKPVRALRGIAVEDSGTLRIGALTTLTEIAESPLLAAKYPVLSSAVGTIAGPLQRNMGTIGGNLCLETRCRWYNQSYFWRKSLGGCATWRPAGLAVGRFGRAIPRRHFSPSTPRPKSREQRARGASL